MSDTLTIGEPVTTSKRTYRVRLEQDTDAESPRGGGRAQLGVMVLSHHRYDLPCEGDDLDRIDEAFMRGGLRLAMRYVQFTRNAVVLPVYGYDHGQLVLQAGDRTGCFADPWDSGVAGLIYAPRDEVAKAYEGYPMPSDDDLVTYLGQEVEEYNSWATGDVYGYIVERLVPACERCGCDERWEDAEEMSSCWGLIGRDYAEQAAREALAEYL